MISLDLFPLREIYSLFNLFMYPFFHIICLNLCKTKAGKKYYPSPVLSWNFFNAAVAINPPLCAVLILKM